MKSVLAIELTISELTPEELDEFLAKLKEFFDTNYPDKETTVDNLEFV